MAKLPKVSPTIEFVKNSPAIIRQLSDSSFAPLARLAGVEAFDAAQERISELLNIPAVKFTRNDSFRKCVVEIGNFLKAADKTAGYQTKFKKDRNGYSFTFFKKPTQGGELNFTTAGVFPGYDLPGFEDNISTADKLSILWAMMAAAGFNFTPSPDGFEARYTPLVVRQGDVKARQKAADTDQIEIATDDLTGIIGLVQRVSEGANVIHTQPMANAVFQSTLRFTVEVSEWGTDVSVSIRPFIDMSFSEALIPFMAETDDKSATDFLVHSWVVDAVDRGVSMNGRRKATSNLPAVDLRVTSEKLRKVSERFQVAKPRLNRFNFCINKAGVPMYVPKVDVTADFMQDHSNFQPGEDGYLNYEDVAHNWKSQVVLVDWFNDVIVYTQASGKLDVYRLLGYIPLDQSSEYVWLNTRLTKRLPARIIANVAKLVDSLVTAEEARAELDETSRSPNAYNAGKITQSASTLFGLLMRPMASKLQPVDNDYRYEGLDFYSPLIKHLFGIEIQELDPTTQNECLHFAAYLRAASRKRPDISMDVMNRLEGIEYFLVMARKFTPEVFAEIKTASRVEAEKRRPTDRDLPEFDIPNLHVGEGSSFKGFMPHQARVVTNRAKGASVSQLGVATGGGKTTLQLVDVLMELERNPTWRPLLVTKPRLVKNMISEINAFTKGKVNVVSLRAGQLKYMATNLKIVTAEALIKWVKAFPPNTIFVCGYTDFGTTYEYQDLEIPNRVLLHDVALPQFLHILRIIGFDSVKLDESHMIKKLTSKRSRYSFSMLAQAKSKSELSGTILNNTAMDLMGQAYGLNPMIFGNDDEAFKDEYNLPGGLIKTAESSYALNDRQRKFVQTISATEEDWAFLLPDLFDVQLAAQMTPKQEKFYGQLMQKAMVELESKMKEGNSSEDGEEDDEEDGDEKFLIAIDATLHTAEQFLVAPDENKQFVTSSDNPSGDDLISPMVRAIDAKLAEIYKNMGADHSNNKTAVFGIHKVASGHFMRYTKFKSLCLHYRSGDEEVIRQFKSNPDKLILVADSTSLREGENLQMLSNIFDMQATWAPGDFKQLLARMYRPDPKGVYSKDTVTHYWITPLHRQNDPTIAGVKLARMISKAISVARFQYEGDKRWADVEDIFGGLDLLKMNLKLIFNSDKSSLAPYYNAWTAFIRWQRELNQQKRKDVAAAIQDENPGVSLIDAQGRVLDKALFTKLCMKEVKSTKMLAGSKRVFTPWEPGALPADIHDMSLTILGENSIERGEFVMTEYGPAIVQSTTDTQVNVELYNRKKAKIYRDRIAVAQGEGIKKLNALITNPTAWAAETYTQITQSLTGEIDVDASLAPRGSKRSALSQLRPTAPAPSVPEANVPVTPKFAGLKPVKVAVKPEEENRLTIEDISVRLLNGFPALVIKDAPSGVENLGWQPTAPYVATSFTSWAAANKFIGLMTKKFAITSTKLDALSAEMELFEQGKTMKLNKHIPDNKIRNFFLTNHRRLASSSDGRERVDPYWVGIGRFVYLAFSQQTHNPKVITWLKTVAAKNPTIAKAPIFIGERQVKIFDNLNDASQDLRALAQKFDIPEGDLRQELRDLKTDITELRAKHTKPGTARAR